MTGPEESPPSAIAAIEAALAVGDEAGAINLAERAVAQGIVHPLTLSLRARRFEAQGRAAEALADLRRAHALAPGDAGVLAALGGRLMRMGQSIEAVQRLDEAVALSPDLAQAWRDLGFSRLALGDVDGARAGFETAARLAPTLPDSHAQLALLAARRGDWPAARSEGQAALALSPALPEAHRALAQAELAAGEPHLAERRLRSILGSLGQRPVERYQAMGLLGDALDRQGRYPEAFAAYLAANTQMRTAQAQRFGRSGLIDAIEGMRQAVEADWPRAARPPRNPPKGPARAHVFLIGFMRSGTTLIEQVLAAEPQVETLEEQEALVSGVNAFMTGREGMLRLRDASEAELDGHRADYWARVRAFGAQPDGRIFVDKKPFDGAKLPLIQRLFPEARIVLTLRDPRDVIFSCFKHRFSVTTYTFELLDLTSAVRFYDGYMRAVATYRAVLPVSLHAYRHEDLVADFEGQVRAICAFLGLPWREEMRDVGQRPRQGLVSSPSALQLVGGLSRDGLQQWRRYEAQLSPSYGPLAPWLDQFGYT